MIYRLRNFPKVHSLTALHRTDFVRHLKVWNEKADLVDRTFFDVAFDIYRRRYNCEETTVIFLAVSDDTDWIKVITI